jgi:hypothetical protein
VNALCDVQETGGEMNRQQNKVLNWSVLTINILLTILICLGSYGLVYLPFKGELQLYDSTDSALGFSTHSPYDGFDEVLAFEYVLNNSVMYEAGARKNDIILGKTESQFYHEIYKYRGSSYLFEVERNGSTIDLLVQVPNYSVDRGVGMDDEIVYAAVGCNVALWISVAVWIVSGVSLLVVHEFFYIRKNMKPKPPPEAP